MPIPVSFTRPTFSDGDTINGAVASANFVSSATVPTGTGSNTACEGNDSRVVGAAQKASNLADMASASTARTNLGVNTLAEIKASIYGDLFPIGEIYISRIATNPATRFGVGTWTYYGEGRTLVGYNAAETEFNAIDNIGGEKAHALSAGELAAHTHSTPGATVTSASNGAHTHTIDPPNTTTGGVGDHDHSYFRPKLEVVTHRGASGANFNVLTGEAVQTDPAGAHAHDVDIPAFDSASAGTHTHDVTVPGGTSGSTGSGTAHNNLQPYITVYFWKRTA